MATATGNSLADIARKEGVSLLDLIAANPQLKDPNFIRAGQQIRLPTHTYSPAQRSEAAERAGMSPTGVPGGSFTPQVAGATTPTAPAISAQGVSGQFATRREYVPGVGYVPYGTRRPLGQVFPRDQATLTPQGVVYAGQAALRQPPPTRGLPQRGVPAQGLLTPAQQAAMAASGGYAAAGRGTGVGLPPTDLGPPTPFAQTPTGIVTNIFQRIVAGGLGALGGGIAGGAGGVVGSIQGGGNPSAQTIGGIIRGAYQGAGAAIQNANIGPIGGVGQQPGTVQTPTATTPPGAERGPSGGVYVSGVGYVYPQTTEQQFFGGSPDVAQLRTESWAKSVAVHAGVWASQTDVPSYTSLQLFIDAMAQLGNTLAPEQAIQVLVGLGYKNTTGTIWYKPRDESYGGGSGAAAGGGFGEGSRNIIGSGIGGGGDGGGRTESGFGGNLATGLYQWRIGA